MPQLYIVLGTTGLYQKNILTLSPMILSGKVLDFEGPTVFRWSLSFRRPQIITFALPNLCSEKIPIRIYSHFLKSNRMKSSCAEGKVIGGKYSTHATYTI